MYYVRCSTRSSGASAKGTPRRALAYISDAHDAERDPSYSHAELAYIARLDPGWKADLEGGRIALVGLGALRGCGDQAMLAREFEDACQPWHDRRGSTGYLSYTFTMPKELSLVAEGHPIRARMGMYAALQSALDAAFPGMEYKAVATVHARNEAGEVHYHAHVLIGKFAKDTARGRVYSLNSRSGGNTGKARVEVLKRAWKGSLDFELKEGLGLVVSQGAPFARPALTLADGSYVPALNRESRRLLDKHLSFRMAETTTSGATKTMNFRWTHFDATIYELASAKGGRGWSAGEFCELFPELARRLNTFEARVATLKRVGYLTTDGCVTEPFTLHYRVHRGDHPELQRLRADLHKRAFGRKGSSETHRGGPRSTGGATGTAASRSAGASSSDQDGLLWEALHRDELLLKRLERLQVSPAELQSIHEEAKRQRPTPQTLQRLRPAVRQRTERPAAPLTPAKGQGIIRAFCAVQNAKVVSFFVISKGLLSLRPGEHAALARRIMDRARIDFFYAKEKRLARVGRRLRPIFSIARFIMPADVERLELALRRCSELPSQESAEPFLRDHRRRLYKNSREMLLAQLRAGKERDARKVDPGILGRGGPVIKTGDGADGLQEERRHPVIDESKPGREGRQTGKLVVGAGGDVAARPRERPALAQLRAGIEVLRIHRPRDYARFAAWKDREEELLAHILARAKETSAAPMSKEEVAGLRAAWIGRLLARERAAQPTEVLELFRSSAGDIVRANARMAAAGVDPPFPAARLQAVALQDVQRAVGKIRGAGFLDDGPVWAVRAVLSPSVIRRMKMEVDAELRRGEEMER